jgi:hypothetical protein
MRRLPWLAVATVATALGLAVWRSPRHRPSPPPAPAGGRVLVRLPQDYRQSSLSVSDDGKDYAFVVTEPDGGCHVVQRDQDGPTYAECSSPRFAPVSKRVFYWAIEAVPRYRRLLRWQWQWGAPTTPVLVIDGTAVETGFGHTAPLAFTADGTRWAVAGKAPDRQVAGKTEPGGVIVLADGRTLGRYTDASRPAFSRDGNHLAYLAQSGDGQVRLIVDGSERHSFERPLVPVPEVALGAAGDNLLQQLRVMYLSDGTLLAIAPGRDGWTVYHDDQPLAAYARNLVFPEQGPEIVVSGMGATSSVVIAGSLSSAKKAPVAAWWERPEGADERWHVMRNGTPDTTMCARYWKNEPPLLSADGQRLAYPCYLHPQGEGNAVTVVVDDTPSGPYPNVSALTFSDNGARFAFNAADGTLPYDWSYHVDGKVYPLRFEQAWPARFNDTGTHIAWEAQRGKRPVLFLDGRGVGSFDEVLWGPVFSAHDTVSWVVRRGRRVVRVEKAARN